jgi:hypothetical protein
MPPRTAAGPRAARRPRARTPRHYNVAGVIKVTETGALEAADALETLAARASDEDTIRSVVPPVRAAFKRLFDEHGQGHWKATKDETTREKAIKGLRIEAMRATDALYESLVLDKRRGGYVSVTARSTRIAIGSRLVQGVMQARAGRNVTDIDTRGEDEAVTALRSALLDNL